ncbi:MAG TPA: zf-HC2 domain-containing protein [Frankiaceae bacterium]|nr:zf-HC2 domain-containing protein [Frankiaceae bacterium]
MTEDHVPIERLAAYAAGDLDATAGVEVEAHVLLCADCRADVEALNRVSRDLAEVEPVTMPADVAARLDAAIAAADAPTGPVGDVLPMVPQRRRPSFAGIAAVAAGVALVAAISVPVITGGGDTPEDAGTATVQVLREPKDTKRIKSDLNYTADNLSPTLATALTRPAYALDTTADSGGVAGPSQLPVAPTSPKAAGPKSESGAPRAVTEGTELASLRLATDAGRLAACVNGLAASQTLAEAKKPLLVDFARFEGKPAVVIVFPTEQRGRIRADRVDVWVVGARCGVTAGDEDVLTFARIEPPPGL